MSLNASHHTSLARPEDLQIYDAVVINPLLRSVLTDEARNELVNCVHAMIEHLVNSVNIEGHPWYMHIWHLGRGVKRALQEWIFTPRSKLTDELRTFYDQWKSFQNLASDVSIAMAENRFRMPQWIEQYTVRHPNMQSLSDKKLSVPKCRIASKAGVPSLVLPSPPPPQSPPPPPRVVQPPRSSPPKQQHSPSKGGLLPVPRGGVELGPYPRRLAPVTVLMVPLTVPVLPPLQALRPPDRALTSPSIAYRNPDQAPAYPTFPTRRRTSRCLAGSRALPCPMYIM